MHTTEHVTITNHEPLHTKTWFQTGGPARWYCAPKTPAALQEAIQWAHAHDVPTFILGEGANILISDDGFDGLVIKPELSDITFTPHSTHTYVTAQAGASFDTLIQTCLDQQLTGLEEFSGIPGTVGGSVYINIHYFQYLLDQFFISARVIDAHTGEIETVDADWFQFGYDQSRLQDKTHYLVDATLCVTPASVRDTAYAQGRRDEIIRHRNKRYPDGGTCGSFFRNFHEDEVYITYHGKKMIFVAYYLDKIGVKGNLYHGGAMVSPQHANMLVNYNNGTSSDIIALARTMQERVYNEFGITPEPECQLIGFEQYPLHA